MVSKLKILHDYYQIDLTEFSDYFCYHGKCYYFSKVNNFLANYYMYLNTIGLRGFNVVYNCMNQGTTWGYILYTYETEPYEFDQIIDYSLNACSTPIKVAEIKKSWSILIDRQKEIVTNYCARINHFEHFVVLSYYYQGLGECAISLLNLINTKTLPQGIEHFVLKDSYCDLLNPDNLVFASRIKDLSDAYKNGYFSVDELASYIRRNNLEEGELYYLWARILFPTTFLALSNQKVADENELKKEVLELYQNIDFEKKRLKAAYQIMKTYIYLPVIPWL